MHEMYIGPELKLNGQIIMRVESLPTGAESEIYWYHAGRHGVEKITLHEDVPAMHCNMRRILVWGERGFFAKFLISMWVLSTGNRLRCKMMGDHYFDT